MTPNTVRTNSCVKRLLVDYSKRLGSETDRVSLDTIMIAVVCISAFGFLRLFLPTTRFLLLYLPNRYHYVPSRSQAPLGA